MQELKIDKFIGFKFFKKDQEREKISNKEKKYRMQELQIKDFMKNS